MNGLGDRPEAVLQAITSGTKGHAGPIGQLPAAEKRPTTERPNSVGSTDVLVWSRPIGTSLLPAVLWFQYGNLRIAVWIPDRLRSSASCAFALLSLRRFPSLPPPPSSLGTSYYFPIAFASSVLPPPGLFLVSPPAFLLLLRLCS